MQRRELTNGLRTGGPDNVWLTTARDALLCGAGSELLFQTGVWCAPTFFQTGGGVCCLLSSKQEVGCVLPTCLPNQGCGALPSAGPPPPPASTLAREEGRAAWRASTCRPHTASAPSFPGCLGWASRTPAPPRHAPPATTTITTESQSSNPDHHHHHCRLYGITLLWPSISTPLLPSCCCYDSPLPAPHAC